MPPLMVVPVVPRHRHNYRDGHMGLNLLQAGPPPEACTPPLPLLLQRGSIAVALGQHKGCCLGQRMGCYQQVAQQQPPAIAQGLQPEVELK